MRIEHKSSCYPEMKPRKRALCASYNQLAFIDEKTQNRKSEIKNKTDLCRKKL
jgi:hypothetical protein